MPIIIEHRRIVGDIAGVLARLESLVATLERLSNGEMPSAQELEAAPLLDPWSLAAVARPCLVGGNVGHPILTAPVIRTSELWAIAPDAGWARTLNRLYRLGQPAGTENAVAPRGAR